ncbi:MAG: thioredoxin family protein, partial [Clostridia bacterium]|nr:thioredoxin family protein [Clostridia bacterium]
KVNVDEEPDLARAWVIRSIPTLLLLKNGELTGRWTGETPMGTILDAVDTENMDHPPQPEPDARYTNALHDYADHTMPRMYNAPLSGLPYDGVPGQFHDLQDTWQTW